MLAPNSQTLLRYKNNSAYETGLKFECEIKMMIISNGRMVGDYECFNKCPYQTSLVCYSPQAQIYVMKKEDLFKCKIANEDNWKFMKEQSEA